MKYMKNNERNSLKKKTNNTQLAKHKILGEVEINDAKSIAKKF